MATADAFKMNVWRCCETQVRLAHDLQSSVRSHVSFWRAALFAVSENLSSRFPRFTLNESTGPLIFELSPVYAQCCLSRFFLHVFFSAWWAASTSNSTPSDTKQRGPWLNGLRFERVKGQHVPALGPFCCMDLRFADFFFACVYLQVIALKMFPACADTWSGRAPRTKWCTSAKTTKSRPLAAASRIAPPMRWDGTCSGKLHRCRCVQTYFDSRWCRGRSTWIWFVRWNNACFSYGNQHLGNFLIIFWMFLNK